MSFIEARPGVVLQADRQFLGVRVVLYAVGPPS